MIFERWIRRVQWSCSFLFYKSVTGIIPYYSKCIHRNAFRINSYYRLLNVIANPSSRLLHLLSLSATFSHIFFFNLSFTFILLLIIEYYAWVAYPKLLSLPLFSFASVFSQVLIVFLFLFFKTKCIYGILYILFIPFDEYRILYLSAL